MSKAHSKRLTIRSGNLIRYRVLLIELSEAESIVKLIGDNSRDHDPYIHLGLVTKALGLEPHLTEELQTNALRRHKSIRPMSREEILRRSLMIFSTHESRPPMVDSVEDKKQMDEARRWFREAVHRTVHPPRHRKIEVFKEGDAKDFISKILNTNMLDDITIDLDEAVKISKINWSNPSLLDVVFEDDFAPDGLEIGFLEKPSRVVFLSPGKPVVEFEFKMLMRWIHSLDSLPGVRELMAEAQKRIVRKQI